MNVLLINGTNLPLKHEIIDFFVNRPIIEYVILLEGNNIITQPLYPKVNSGVNSKVKIIFADFLAKKQIFNTIKELFTNLKEVQLVLYVDNSLTNFEKDFSQLDILAFKNLINTEVVKKIFVFQALIITLKQYQLSSQFIILVPHTAQTRLINNNIKQNVLFSSLHMLTTSFADEFIDYNLYCNGVIDDEYVFKTLEWLLFEKKDKIQGKLFSNKQIIEW